MFKRKRTSVNIALSHNLKITIKITILAINVCIIHQLGKKHSESDSNDIVSLCTYLYSCGVDSAIL